MRRVGPTVLALALGVSVLPAAEGVAAAAVRLPASKIYVCIAPTGEVRVHLRTFRCRGNGRLLVVSTSPARGPLGVPGAAGSPGVVGPQGGQGPAGILGPQGPAGVVGQAGAPGASGATGLGGVQGDAGSQGDAGPAGPQGPIGQTGATGTQGITGTPGAAGQLGPTGPQGPTGPLSPGVALAYATITITAAGPEVSSPGSWNAGATTAVARAAPGAYCLTALPAGVVHVVASADTALARFVTAGVGAGSVCAGVPGTDVVLRVRDTTGTLTNLATGDVVYVLAH